MNTDSDVDLAMSIDIEELAAILDVSGRHLRRVLGEQGVDRAEYGKVALKAGVQAFLINFKAGLARRRARSADGERLLAAKAGEIEARNGRTESRLIDVPDHRDLAPYIFARLRHHLADALAAAGLDEATQDQLRAEVERITKEGERRFEKLTDEALARR